MRQPMRQEWGGGWSGEFAEERASIDGRAAFGSAFLALGCALLVLLDRIGVPERLVTVLGPVLALVSLAVLGGLLHSMRISRFYAAGRRVPAIYAGFAAAALIAGIAASCLVALPPGVSLLDFALGLFIGAAIAGLLVRPLVRKSGAFSIPDLIGARFPDTLLRIAVAVLVALIAFALAHAGVEIAVRALSLWSGMSRPLAAALAGIVLAFMVIPGGFSGAIWGAIAAGAVFVAAFALPLIVLALRGIAPPFPIFGDEAAWQSASAHLSGWHVLGDAPGSLDMLTTIALAIGLAVLVPVIAPAFAAPDRRSARRAGIVSLLWLCLFAALAAATVAASSVALVQSAVGQKPDRLSPALYTASKNGVFLICGTDRLGPIPLRDVCATKPGFNDALRESDLAPRRDFLFTSLPLLAGLGSAFSGLVAAALAALGLALASVGLHACATALGHDAFHRVRDAEALTSRRLAITRLVLIAAIVVATAWASTTAVDSRAAIAVALVLSISGLAPLIALILWPLASARDALLALLAGVAVTALGMLLGVSAGYLAGVSLVGGVVGLAVGIGSSVMRGGERDMGSAFVRTMLRGKAEMPNLDRGA